MARALNVVAMIAIPAMPGTRMFRFFWSPLKIAPKRNRNSSGRKKLKNAAVGLRQNILRSRRYWFHARAAGSGIGGLLLGGQLEVDVLERGARHRQVLELRAAGERGAGQ